ncbi:hypothetical protein HG530_014376 [Fusarium avenaceum]|nr:hypothetical protein HG530_014376 [Fusarium avenaceum]
MEPLLDRRTVGFSSPSTVGNGLRVELIEERRTLLPRRLRSRSTAMCRGAGGCPDENRSDDAAHEAHLFGAFHGPVDRTTDTSAIFTRSEEESISKAGDPERQECKKESMVSLPSAQFEELGAQRCFENQQVEIDHGRRARRVVQRIALLYGGRQDGARAGDLLGALRRSRGAFDDGIDIVGHVGWW